MSDFLPPDAAIERRARELGEMLFARMDAAPVPGFFSRKGAYARLMEWSMKDPAFKTQLFRFVDVVPACRDLDVLARHLTGFLRDWLYGTKTPRMPGHPDWTVTPAKASLSAPRDRRDSHHHENSATL